MSYARSPRPVCSMTIGMRFACMSEAGPSLLSRIVPGLLFMGNAFRRLWRHDSCSRQQLGERAIANELRAQCRTRRGWFIDRAHALRHLPLARRDRVDLRTHFVVRHIDRLALRVSIEDQLRTHLAFRTRRDLLAYASERGV